MGISHQTGSIVLRGKAWYGFYRKEVVDPTTDDVRSVRVCVRLGIKSQMTKLKARDALKAEIAKQTGQLADGRILKDGTVTFEWFVRNRYFPLRQGDWRPETAIEKTAQIEIDLIAKFGSRTIESIQRIQTVFGENPMRLITIKTQRLLYLPALILLLASFAHAATPTKKFEAGKKAKVTGTIVSRNGDLVTVKEKKESTSAIVNITDDTKIEREKSFRLRKAHMDVTAMLPGLTRTGCINRFGLKRGTYA